ncbi:hypothetical protein D030_1568A, partial [Vibrio parahaemolyticus AQ3810]
MRSSVALVSHCSSDSISNGSILKPKKTSSKFGHF